MKNFPVIFAAVRIALGMALGAGPAYAQSFYTSDATGNLLASLHKADVATAGRTASLTSGPRHCESANTPRSTSQCRSPGAAVTTFCSDSHSSTIALPCSATGCAARVIFWRTICLIRIRATACDHSRIKLCFFADLPRYSRPKPCEKGTHA